MKLEIKTVKEINGQVVTYLGAIDMLEAYTTSCDQVIYFVKGSDVVGKINIEPTEHGPGISGIYLIRI